MEMCTLIRTETSCFVPHQLIHRICCYIIIYKVCLVSDSP